MTGFLITRYVEQNLLPSSLEDKLLGYDYSSPPPSLTRQVYTPRIPSTVTETPTTVDLATLYPWAGLQGFPPSVKVLKVPNEKDDNAWAAKAQDSHPDFQQTSLLFRGISLKALEQSLFQLFPTQNEVSHQKEFGTGIYATLCLTCAKRYVGPGGVVIVFRHMDTEKLEVWNISLEEWKLVVAHHLDLQVQHRAEVFAKFRKADVIIGPMSQRLRVKRDSEPKQTNDIQYTYRPYSSLERLPSSLIRIIYIG